MRSLSRLLVVVTFVAALTACHTPKTLDVAARSVKVRAVPVAIEKHPRPRLRTRAERQAFHRLIVHLYLDALWHAAYDIPAHLLPVAQCVKDHESGIYDEHSHPLHEGSGAYQFVPSTWRHWFGRWRDAVKFVGLDYLYAWLAPKLIQDAVFGYTLTHGGASNWSNRYGFDPCTEGLTL